MCLERLVKLKCRHYESSLFDKCKTRNGRDCEQYRQVVLKEDKGRSCAMCKAELAANLGVANPVAAKR